MSKAVKFAGLSLVGILILAQFFQPEKNLSEGSGQDDLTRTLEVPEEVASLLKNSCYDCHSNNTRYPWYNRISPVSWYLNKHVEAGKEALNFSEFGQLKTRSKIGDLSTICEVVEAGSMPLVSFTIIHRDANLDEEDKSLICDWAESETESLMKAGN